VVLSDLAAFTHLVTRLKVVPETAADPTLSEAERVRGAGFAERLSIRALSRAWQILLKAIPEVQAAPRPLAAAEMAIVRLAYAADLPTPDEALRQLKAEAIAAPSEAPAPTARPPLPPIPDLRGGSAALAAAPRTEPVAAPAPMALSPAPVAVAAPAARPAPVAPPTPRLGRFEDLIALADANRDILLRTALERDVHLVRFEEGRIEIRLASGGRPSLATDIATAIERWTGRRWVVTLSKEEGAPTLDAAARAATETRRENAAADPFVREVLTRFPGAEIVDVRETATEALPTAEQEILGEGDAARVDEVEDDDA
jgi:DNA polymerase III subunit gamma/tau